MLQISNLEEGKSDWISETQLIIPVVENEELQSKEIDGMAKHTITLNALEGTDQTLLTNVNGHTFVIGLDRTLFENYSSKSDLLLMPNPDLKLLPADSKLAYTLPIEQSKNDIIWENNTFEKPLSKDILNVIQESKGWNDIDKTNDLCLEDINNENKVGSDFLIEPHLVSDTKKLRSDNAEYIVGYYPLTESCDAVLVPASLMTLPQKLVDNTQNEKPVIIDNENSKNTDHLYINDNTEDTLSGKWIKTEQNLMLQTEDNFDKRNNRNRMSILKVNNTHENSLILSQDNININKFKETVIPLIDSTGSLMETKSKDDIYNDIEKCMTKDEKCDGKIIGNDNSLLEQNLPLKKKAKMKKSPVNGSFNFPSADALKDIHSFDIIQNDTGSQAPDSKLTTSTDTLNASDSDEPLSGTKRKTEGNTYNFKKKKKTSDKPRLTQNESGSRKVVLDDNRPFESIMDVLNRLKSEKYINEAVFELLRTGLQEMNADILKEMYSKRSTTGSEYSSHLKAFALMLHFKQPTAFNRLRELFQNGWPSLSIIKDWKRTLNNRRPKNRCEKVKN